MKRYARRVPLLHVLTLALFATMTQTRAHMSVASSDGTVRGGHVTDAYVFPTLELFLTVYPTALHKEKDEATGLELIDPLVK